MKSILKVLIIAAHPDDEVIGMGGTIKKLSQLKNTVHLCVVSEGATAQYTDKKMIKVRKDACLKASKILGITKVDFLEFPDMRLDSVGHLEINKKLEKIIKEYKPDIVYTTPNNDLNLDHKKVFESTLVATRPLSTKVKKVLCFELPGIKREPFNPNVYEDISANFYFKIKAYKAYKTEIRKFPHPRSLQSIESLAKIRGIEAGLQKAEAFYLVRQIES